MILETYGAHLQRGNTRHGLRSLRSIAATVAIAIFCTPAFSADPLTLLLLRVLRDKLISTGVESAVDRATQQQSTVAAPPAASPGFSAAPYGLDDAQLRRLVDEGFIHLTASQRDEVYVSVRRILADPKNAADVPAIISDLATKASAVRQAHEQISALSFARKQRIVAEARSEYERMPPESREQMAAVLRQRLVPLPADLTDMILSEFDRVQATAAPAPAVTTLAADAVPVAPTSSTASTASPTDNAPTRNAN